MRARWTLLGREREAGDQPEILTQGCCSRVDCLALNAAPRRRGFLLFPFRLVSSPLFFFLPPSRNSDPRSHSRLFSPLPTTVRALHFIAKKISAVSSLVDSRRSVLTHARRSQHLTVDLSFYFSNNEFKLSSRRDSNSRANTMNSININSM